MSEDEMQRQIDVVLNMNRRLDRECLKARHLVDLRKWAIERLLLMPEANALMRPGWAVDSRGGSTRVPPKLFLIADEIVDYVANGEHPKPAEGTAP